MMAPVIGINLPPSMASAVVRFQSHALLCSKANSIAHCRRGTQVDKHIDPSGAQPAIKGVYLHPGQHDYAP
jgi:hypothetical protein